MPPGCSPDTGGPGRPPPPPPPPLPPRITACKDDFGLNPRSHSCSCSFSFFFQILRAPERGRSTYRREEKRAVFRVGRLAFFWGFGGFKGFPKLRMAATTEDALFRSIEGMQNSASKPWWVSSLLLSLFFQHVCVKGCTPCQTRSRRSLLDDLP